jgi:hypothetical protein
MEREEHPSFWRSENIRPFECEHRTRGCSSTTHPLKDVASSSGPKCLNRKIFTFFHLCLITIIDDRDAFVAMYAIRMDAVAVEVANGFYWREFISGSVLGYKNRRTSFCIGADHNLVGLHNLLYYTSDFSQTGINSGFLDTSVCGCSYGFQ